VSIEDVYSKIAAAVGDVEDQAVGLSLDIHAHPELAFAEHRACRSRDLAGQPRDVIMKACRGGRPPGGRPAIRCGSPCRAAMAGAPGEPSAATSNVPCAIGRPGHRDGVGLRTGGLARGSKMSCRDSHRPAGRPVAPGAIAGMTLRNEQSVRPTPQTTHIADSARADYGDCRLVTPPRSTNSARRLRLVCRDGLGYW